MEDTNEFKYLGSLMKRDGEKILENQRKIFIMTGGMIYRIFDKIISMIRLTYLKLYKLLYNGVAKYGSKT
jgi:hypothetical protein